MEPKTFIASVTITISTLPKDSLYDKIKNKLNGKQNEISLLRTFFINHFGKEDYAVLKDAYENTSLGSSFVISKEIIDKCISLFTFVSNALTIFITMQETNKSNPISVNKSYEDCDDRVKPMIDAMNKQLLDKECSKKANEKKMKFYHNLNSILLQYAESSTDPRKFIILGVLFYIMDEFNENSIFRDVEGIEEKQKQRTWLGWISGRGGMRRTRRKRNCHYRRKSFRRRR
jgi:hypothetical protein